MQIGPHVLPSPLVLAPMAGVTDRPFRTLCRRLGAGLEPVAWAADGTVEGAVLTDAPGWFLAVQWHPEDTVTTDPAQLALFRALVDAARAR